MLQSKKNPNDANLYNVMGRVYETGLKDYANAEKNFQIALEKDPNLTDALSNIGRIYYNQGVNKLSEANMINDSKKYHHMLVELALTPIFFLISFTLKSIRNLILFGKKINAVITTCLSDFDRMITAFNKQFLNQ